MGCKSKGHFIFFCFEGCNFILQFLVSLFPTINLKLKSLNLIQSPLSAFGSSQSVSVSSQPPVVHDLDLVDVHDAGADHGGDTLELCKDDVTVALLCWGHNCGTSSTPQCIILWAKVSLCP